MNVFILPKAHIDTLVSAALAWGLADAAEADELGRELWGANLASVAHRYPHDVDGERNGPAGLRDADVAAYRYEPVSGRPDPEVVSYAARALERNSLDVPGWTQTSVCAWLAGLGMECGLRAAPYAQSFGPVNRHALAIPPISAWDIEDRGVFVRALELRQANAGAQ